LENETLTIPLGSLTEPARGILAREQDVAQSARSNNWKLFFNPFGVNSPKLASAFGMMLA
jgi:hypothetical protein